MTTRIVQDQNLEKHMEKQMGCMTGFFQLFDRHQLLTGKRLYTTKRLTPSAAVDSSSQTEKSIGSPSISKELGMPASSRSMPSPSPDRFKPSPLMDIQSPAPVTTYSPEMPPKSPLPLPVFELKEGTKSSWKFCKEAPRLSLDSRAVVDAKGSLQPRVIRTNTSITSSNRSEDRVSVDGDDKQHRSPSVIARLMGLEQLPHSNPEPKKAELRRSASESRVSRDLSQYRVVEGNNFQPHSMATNLTGNANKDNAAIGHNNTKSNARNVDRMECLSRNLNSEQARTLNRGSGVSPWKSPQQRKSFFDSADVFPEPKQTMSIYGEIEKRLKMRGIDEPSKDLETLKHILEALQLKGLLHSKRPPTQINNKNFVYDQRFSSDESPIVVMKPWRSSTSPVRRRVGSDSPPSSFRCSSGIRRNNNCASENLSPVVTRHERPGIIQNARSPTRTRNSSSPTRNESNAKMTNSLVKRKALSIETQRRVNEPTESRRVSPVGSPKLTPKRNGSDQTSPNRYSRNKKSSNAKIISVVTEDESSSLSESTLSTSSQTDTEKSKTEEYKEGRNLLERCDKLLHSIAEMTATELQPSPVSVLDSSFYKDEYLSPSPVLKRSINFQAIESEEDIWGPVSPIQTKCEENSDDCDFNYITDILRASNYLPEDSDVFLLLEKQQYLKGKNTSKISTLERKLIFDTITEILYRNRQLPPWKAVEKTSPEKIWSEFQRIRQRDASDDLFEIICGVLKKDLAGDAINGWGDCPAEMSEAVLCIERLIFKDLIAESIQDLAGKSTLLAPPRRKLVF